MSIVLIDDLHFAPDESRSLFAKLTQAIATDAVLLIGTLRPGDHESWLVSISNSPHVTRKELGRLGAKDLGSLLLDAFGSVSLAEELEEGPGEGANGHMRQRRPPDWVFVRSSQAVSAGNGTNGAITRPASSPKNAPDSTPKKREAARPPRVSRTTTVIRRGCLSAQSMSP